MSGVLRVVTLSRRHVWLGGSTAALAAVVGIAAWRWSRDRVPPPGPFPDMALGALTAPVTLIEYGSPSCPHCARFSAETLPELKTRYIDSGQMRFIYRELPLNTFDAGAIMLLRCARQDRFFPLLDALHRTQGNWTGARDKDEYLQRLAALGGDAGLERETFDRCIDDQALHDKIDAAVRLAVDHGINSTPTFFINGHKTSGYKSIAEMRMMIDPLLPR